MIQTLKTLIHKWCKLGAHRFRARLAIMPVQSLIHLRRIAAQVVHLQWTQNRQSVSALCQLEMVRTKSKLVVEQETNNLCKPSTHKYKLCENCVKRIANCV